MFGKNKNQIKNNCVSKIKLLTQKFLPTKKFPKSQYDTPIIFP